MKLALLSDIHANLQALQACLQHAREHGATQLALLGDLVGYGGDPAAVVEVLMHEAAHGAWLARGNHDALAVQPPQVASQMGQLGAHWTHAQLSAAQRNFLATLPVLQQHQSWLLVHASAYQPELRTVSRSWKCQF